MESVQKGFPLVPQSITNPNVERENALDRNQALSFIEFIKVVKVTFEPDTLQSYYTFYLNKWNTNASDKNTDNKKIIIDRYRDFLKELSIFYSNETEKKFLSVIDFNDPSDLSIAISFYSKKLREVASYYRGERENLQNVAVKNKTRGSNFNIKKRATEIVLDFLENREDSKFKYDVETIKSNINVDLTEYFDTYTSYFNQEPSVDDYGKHFKSYDPSELPSDNIFLGNNTDLIDEVFEGLDLELRDLLETNELFESKKNLTEKYIGTDFYYISSNSVGDFVYEKLIEAEAPYRNFLNQNYPTTASVFANSIETEREAGFFKPTKTGINVIQANAIDFGFKESYEPDSLYIFPDPNIYTNDQEILVFNIEPAEFVKNLTSGLAKLQPLTDSDDTSYLGYSSTFFERNENTDMSFLFNEGYIFDSKTDIYSNTFGLVKDGNLFRENLTTIETKKILNLVLNGYQFYDSLFNSEFSFDYSVSDKTTFLETKRSGITSFTNGLTTIGDNTPQLPSSAYNIFFRYFAPYEELIRPTTSNTDLIDNNVKTASVKDGAFFMKRCDEFLPEPRSSDLSAAYDGGLQYYYSELIEAGIAGLSGRNTLSSWNTLQRALCDSAVPTTSGTFFVNYFLSGIQDDFTRMEGGKFTDTLLFDYSPQKEEYFYDSTVLEPSILLSDISSKEGRYDAEKLAGQIFVNNKSTDVGSHLFTAVNYLSSKHSPNVRNDLSSRVVNFDLLYDTLFLETSSFFVIEPLRFENNNYVDPFTNNISLSINTNNFDKISNRYSTNLNVYYYQIKSLSNNTDTKALSVYPEIYKYSYAKKKTEKIFPKSTSELIERRSLFVLSGVDIRYKESDTPVISYRSDIDMFNISYLLKDQNKSPLLVNYIVNIDSNDNVLFMRDENLRAVYDNKTYTFENISRTLTSFNFNISSVPPGSESNSLIL
jgi:hypothetical protein